MTFTPPIRMVPVRLEVLVFAATVYVAVPDPLPIDVVEIQRAPDAASQLQPANVVTAIEPLPPSALMVTVVGEREYEQGAAA